MKLADLRTRDGHPDARAARIYRETLRSARDFGIPARRRRRRINAERTAYHATSLAKVARTLGRSRSRLAHLLGDEARGGPLTQLAELMDQLPEETARDIMVFVTACYEHRCIAPAATDTLVKRFDALVHAEAVADAKEDEARVRRSPEWPTRLRIEAGLNVELALIHEELEARNVDPWSGVTR